MYSEELKEQAPIKPVKKGNFVKKTEGKAYPNQSDLETALQIDDFGMDFDSRTEHTTHFMFESVLVGLAVKVVGNDVLALANGSGDFRVVSSVKKMDENQYMVTCVQRSTRVPVRVKAGIVLDSGASIVFEDGYAIAGSSTILVQEPKVFANAINVVMIQI